MASITLNTTEYLSGLDQERIRVMNETIAISHSAREMALTADMFSERTRMKDHGPLRLQQVEGHLAQMRRNCADAQHMATAVRMRMDDAMSTSNGDPTLTWRMIQSCDETLRDAQLRLSLADFAYDRAAELA